MVKTLIEKIADEAGMGVIYPGEADYRCSNILTLICQHQEEQGDVVERVAKAMYAHAYRAERRQGDCVHRWKWASDGIKSNWIEGSKVAIAAMNMGEGEPKAKGTQRPCQPTSPASLGESSERHEPEPSEEEFDELANKLWKKIKPSTEAQYIRSGIKMDSGKYNQPEADFIPGYVWDLIDVAAQLGLEHNTASPAKSSEISVVGIDEKALMAAIEVYADRTNFYPDEMRDDMFAAISAYEHARPRTPRPVSVCPYVITSDEGTSHCSLAESPQIPEVSLEELAKEIEKSDASWLDTAERDSFGVAYETYERGTERRIKAILDHLKSKGV
ncbi:MAG: hypothetical protein KGL39_39940 [Patescibacteria group bacterium]|nr:hypothetical protein [Patescibacteria group bacterium]